MDPIYIDTDKLTKSRLEVIILRVLSPLLFWVRLKNGDRDLMELEEELALRMARRSKFLIVMPEEIKLEMDIVIQERDGWRRGWIQEVCKENNTVRIRLGDHGRSIWRPMHEIYHMEDRFRDLPWQAIACGLAYTTSSINTTLWPKRTNDLCQLLAEGRNGWMNIILPLWKGAALVKLTVQGENYESTFNLRDMLIKLGHAKLSAFVSKDVSPSV